MITVFSDLRRYWQLGLQEPASPIMEGIVHFHHDLMAIIIGIVVLVGWMMLRATDRLIGVVARPSSMVHGSVIEIVWTIIPAIVLVGIAVPSFALLLSMEDHVRPSLTVKVIGHQWLWELEINDGRPLVRFDSLMLSQPDITKGGLRLLEVDNRLVLPVWTHIRFLVTAVDVLHSWAVPRLAVKVDAVPGRLNQASTLVTRPGTLLGQCREICGVYHGFMPICVDAVSVSRLVGWLKTHNS